MTQKSKTKLKTKKLETEPLRQPEVPPYAVVPDSCVEDIVSFPSGAKSSGKLPRYDLIPRGFLEALGDRFAEGAEKYGEFNYRKGFGDPEFVKDRINHMFRHLFAFMRPVSNEELADDNLAAIAWGVAFLIECECTNIGRETLISIREEYVNGKIQQTV